MDSKDKVNMPELDDWYKAMLERYKDPKSIEMINSFVKVLKEIAAESNKMYSKDKVNEPELDDWYKAFIEIADMPLFHVL
ncbi:hypothetical protein L195_g018710 [Trifolium pratense]|uniref:Uncharacterized protein n=1 Tax=Trifolium pratense TaxID=57577 RepID=A0A2K3MXK3_TRIPR|nr:hypothetical protein L195_g018710 [Trifolium pratense]